MVQKIKKPLGNGGYRRGQPIVMMGGNKVGKSMFARLPMLTKLLGENTVIEIINSKSKVTLSMTDKNILVNGGKFVNLIISLKSDYNGDLSWLQGIAGEVESLNILGGNNG